MDAKQVQEMVNEAGLGRVLEILSVVATANARDAGPEEAKAMRKVAADLLTTRAKNLV